MINLYEIAKWGLQPGGEYENSACWNRDLEVAIKCAVKEFEEFLSKPYPIELANIPNRPVIYRLVRLENIEDLNRKKLGKSWFANPEQVKKPEFFDITKKEMDYKKESYITRDPNVEIWREHLNTNILNDYSSILTGIVADFGCNHGACTIIASQNENIEEIIGIDINKESLDIANKLLIDNNITKIKYLYSDLSNLEQIPSNYFDNASFVQAHWE